MSAVRARLGRLAGLRALRPSLGLLAVAAAVAAVMATGLLRPVEDAFAHLRFSLLRHQPSQALTVVEIDAPSIRAAGRWPWPRDRFAVAIRNLEAAGAKTVGFDVDFSLQSDAAADRSMAEVIAVRPGAVILPTFVQEASRKGALVETHPLQGLSDSALIASVNVPVDTDGRVRRYHFGFGGGETYRQSMGAALSEAPGQRTGPFLLDYSIQPYDVPRLSFEDVFQNRFDKTKVAGKAILVGARALELGDTFSTPPYGTVPGVYLHALAFEQLRAGRALFAPAGLVTFGLAMALAFWLRAARLDRDKGASLAALVRRHAFAAAAILLVPVAVQAVSPISLEVAPLILAQALCVLWATRAELDRRAKAIVAEREAGLLHLALHEPETELPNRRALLAGIAERLAPTAEDAAARCVAVAAVGIDRYPAIRAAVGYGLSNLVVRAVAGRIEAACPGARVAHLSTSVLGLAVAAPDAAGLEAVIAGLAQIDPNYEVGGHRVDAHVKLGVAYAGEDADADSLLEHAALALDLARRDDEALVVFDPASLAETQVNLALMTDMQKGLAEGQFELHYQPKWSARDGSVTSAEGLIRWRHPTQGNIRPDHFVGVAEETGRIRELTLWTVERALEDAARLQAAGRPMLLSVNISGRLIVDDPFCAAVLAMAKGREKQLCLEITETALISNTEAAQASIAAFRAAGMKISIDDYGAGLSSLSYLKMIDANELKLDRSLVLEVVESERDRKILKSTVDLAHGLGMTVVAEGVETEEICGVLASLGCDLIQGWLIARPMPLAALEDFLRQREAA
jgi:EAL domain-containing protein (putative c-di-GMP-specific phosphodiesterase class I)/CHASE2 domain-containing sensor protein/GGDEF domain-containing protein